ncbi:hypothetical protein Gotri_006191 [Gossypium trilobum]|uniref:Uncharacterized protein n=1 Tax=Gossypium trilobum TaxID=34281 RepID=A0A7J9EZ33_9ROSI|nr:hypothetical protein [Gossypium trilobum]
MAEFQSQQYKRGAKACAKWKGHGFSTKCASLVKQERARLYILRRCATMLLCWYIQGYNFINHANPVWFYGAYNVEYQPLVSFLCF